nr:sulfite exporter TauE/SafE family protein [Calditrichia bacterium]
MPETPVLVTILIILSASFLRSAVGFGDALVSVPPLTLLLGTETAMPLVVLVGLTIAGTILAFNWKSVRFSAAAKLIGAAMLGILPGAMMLRFMPESYLKIMVGLVVAGFGLYNLRRPVLPHLPGGK